MTDPNSNRNFNNYDDLLKERRAARLREAEEHKLAFDPDKTLTRITLHLVVDADATIPEDVTVIESPSPAPMATDTAVFYGYKEDWETLNYTDAPVSITNVEYKRFESIILAEEYLEYHTEFQIGTITNCTYEPITIQEFVSIVNSKHHIGLAPALSKPTIPWYMTKRPTHKITFNMLHDITHFYYGNSSLLNLNINKNLRLRASNHNKRFNPNQIPCIDLFNAKAIMYVTIEAITEEDLIKDLQSNNSFWVIDKWESEWEGEA